MGKTATRRLTQHHKDTPYERPCPQFQDLVAESRTISDQLGSAKSTLAAHRSALKSFRDFCGDCGATEDMVRAETTDSMCAYATWLTTYKSTNKGVISAASARQYISSARGAFAAHRSPLPPANKYQLERHLDALDRREVQTKGIPEQRKHPLMMDMLVNLCSDEDYLAADADEKPCAALMPDFTFNKIMATAGTAIAFATANRHCNIAVTTQKDFNPKVHCCRDDFQTSKDGLRFLHKPTKPDQAGKTWKGWSPPCPAIPGHPACPIKALRIRDRLLPAFAGANPLLMVKHKGILRPMRTDTLKQMGTDRALPMCPPSVTSVSTRHGHATVAIERGQSAETISQFAKWKDPNSWRTYARVSKKAAESYFSSMYSTS